MRRHPSREIQKIENRFSVEGKAMAIGKDELEREQ